jgi:hypothetical protein
MRLEGGAALVTGGGSGIGAATCAGSPPRARVAVTDLNADTAQAVAAELDGRSLLIAWGAGLFAAVAIVWALYAAAVAGARRVQGGGRPVAQAFVHSLVPIALAYVGAHYVSLLLLQGQAVGPLTSDPLGTGANLLGTAGWGIDYAFSSFTVLWYLQVAFVLSGHLAAVVLAHDRALVVFDEPRQAMRSQYWMLGVMIAFTTLALWLLSEASKG